jgi:hypothetical protein
MIQNLNRRIIIERYSALKKKDHRSTYHIIKVLAPDLGYSLDVNGSNSYLMKVIRDYTEKRHQQGRDLA